ncbi:DUF916 and DUF3324 domain-containing protein [Enterococcus gallinarum]|uniref:DUF916 and DUF3324 domain-containing protein n=1 Tax=Enterococcus gallinarum TaxID=1353 RepID=UPI0012E1AB29|nr:DUF916 and DUF3324 domain-containing protein [Enterococcus gallinarum]MUO32395.1 DUF3324 domain-containing protein [Enterococcus gallinarum]
MRKFLQNAVWLLLFISFVYFPVTRGYAETTRFTVVPELPQNQTSEATYFDLLVNKETVQELTVAVHNTSSEEITVAADALNSYSASTGIISYQKEKTAEDYGGKSFTSFIIEPHKVVRLKPDEQREMSFTLNLKETAFAGEILGAFLFEEIKPQATASEADASLESNYQLQLGIRMRQSLQELPKPDLKLIETKAVEKNGKPALKSSISNVQPVAFGKISVNTVIRDKNRTIIGGFKSENFQFAQNSVLDLYSEFEQEELKPGTYTIRIELSSQRGTWVFDDEVVIDRQAAKAVNQTTIYAAAIAQRNLVFYLLIAIIILLIAIILFLLLKRRKKNEESE